MSPFIVSDYRTGKPFVVVDATSSLQAMERALAVRAQLESVVPLEFWWSEPLPEGQAVSIPYFRDGYFAIFSPQTATLH